MRQVWCVLLLAALITAVGCGGGGSAGENTPKPEPITPTRKPALANEDDVASLEKLGVELERDHENVVRGAVAVGSKITDAELAHLGGLPGLETLEIAEMGGRTVAKNMRMSKAETPDEWTQMTVNDAEFDIQLEDRMFTLSNLRNPRQ